MSDHYANHHLFYHYANHHLFYHYADHHLFDHYADYNLCDHYANMGTAVKVLRSFMHNSKMCVNIKRNSHAKCICHCICHSIVNHYYILGRGNIGEEDVPPLYTLKCMYVLAP